MHLLNFYFKKIIKKFEKSYFLFVKMKKAWYIKDAKMTKCCTPRRRHWFPNFLEANFGFKPQACKFKLWYKSDFYLSPQRPLWRVGVGRVNYFLNKYFLLYLKITVSLKSKCLIYFGPDGNY